MDDLNVIDQFMAAFIAYIDSGFGLLGGDVGFLTTILIGVDITLAGLFWALGGEDDVIAKFLKKILYVGVFALILNSFQTLSEIIFSSFAGLGLVASGGAIGTEDLLMPGRLAGTGFEAAWPLLEQAKELVGPISFFDNFVEIAALVWQSLQSRVVPYVVEVDKLGQALAVAKADADYRPTDPQIAWHLGRFITHIRARSLDAVLMRDNWLAAYDFATARAALFLGEYARAANPFAEVGRRTVSVQITSVVRASDNSFRVNWTEQAFERGSLSGTSRWTAMITIKIRPPRSAEVLRKNPLGLYVDAIDWSRELETPTSATPGRARAAEAAVAWHPDAEPQGHLPLGSPLVRAPRVEAPNQPEGMIL